MASSINPEYVTTGSAEDGDIDVDTFAFRCRPSSLSHFAKAYSIRGGFRKIGIQYFDQLCIQLCKDPFMIWIPLEPNIKQLLLENLARLHVRAIPSENRRVLTSTTILIPATVLATALSDSGITDVFAGAYGAKYPTNDFLTAFNPHIVSWDATFRARLISMLSVDLRTDFNKELIKFGNNVFHLGKEVTVAPNLIPSFLLIAPRKRHQLRTNFHVLGTHTHHGNVKFGSFRIANSQSAKLDTVVCSRIVYLGPLVKLLRASMGTQVPNYFKNFGVLRRWFCKIKEFVQFLDALDGSKSLNGYRLEMVVKAWRFGPFMFGSLYIFCDYSAMYVFGTTISDIRIMSSFGEFPAYFMLITCPADLILLIDRNYMTTRHCHCKNTRT